MSAPYKLINPVFQAFQKGTNLPLSGGKVQFYLTGTTTPQPVYPTLADALAGTNPLTNPVVLDVNGRIDQIFGNAIYDIIISDSNNVVQDTMLAVSWSPAASLSSALSEWQETGLTPTFISATSFTVLGNQTSLFMVRRRIKTTNTGGILYGTVVSSVFSSGPNLTTIVIENDSGSLDAGLSDVATDILNIPSGEPVDPMPILGGGTTAYTVTVARAPQIAGSTFSAIINVTNTGPVTIVVNGQSSKTVTKFGTVALSAGDMPVNGLAAFRYDGTRWQLLNPNVATIGGVLQNLKVLNNPGTPLTKIDVTFNALNVGPILVAQPATLTLDAGTIGANGLDIGVLGASEWYYLFDIYNPTTNTNALLLTLVAPSNTNTYAGANIPAGYIYSRFISTFRTDGSNHFLLQSQVDQHVTYLINNGGAAQVLTNGNSPTFAAIDCRSVVPPPSTLVFATVLFIANVNTTYAKLFYRPTGSGLTTGIVIGAAWDEANPATNMNTTKMLLSNSQSFDYKVDVTTTQAYVDITEYYLPL